MNLKKNLKEYLEKLRNILKNKYIQIIENTIYLWIIIPIFCLLLYVTYAIIKGIENNNLIEIIIKYINVTLPWYYNLFVNPIEEIVKITIIAFIVLNYIYLIENKNQYY